MEKPVLFKNLEKGKVYRFKMGRDDVIGKLNSHSLRLNIQSRLPYSLFSDVKNPSIHYQMPNPRQTFYEQVSINHTKKNMNKNNKQTGQNNKQTEQVFSLSKAMQTLKRRLQGGRKTLRNRTYRKRN